jgi:F0F1-type ATP synthase assembly protein I
MPKPEPGENLGDKPAPSRNPVPANQWLSLLNLGWVFLATMGLCVFGGLWMDKRYGTAPVFILTGVLIGFAVSGYSFYKTLRKLNGDPEGKPQV